ncbi:GntR family transcriptional regulator [Catenulispora rubra]|uniref:GntR family transcriptional regulator n=1 Tax=Catenulispora rubra TaxID=280293 RepID=UPI0018923A0C|nr:GntR family transcriptional regulator [Catenulispora rubra]
MAEVVRADALHRQLANIIREAIESGEYPIGSLLPSEDALGKQHKVSRSTVRLALNTLRMQGLIAVRVGSGSTVLPGPDAKTVTAWRTTETGPDRLTDVSEPDRFTSTIGERLADLLDLDADEPTFVQEVRGTDPETGRTVTVRRILPFSACEGTSLETKSFPDRPELLATLTKAHGKLTTAEYIRPLIPAPDDATALDLPEGTPILETTRITHAGAKGVLAEIERAGGDGIQHAYCLS